MLMETLSLIEKLLVLKSEFRKEWKWNKSDNESQTALVTDLSQRYFYTSGENFSIMVANLSHVDLISDRADLKMIHYDYIEAFGTIFGIWVFQGSGEFTNRNCERFWPWSTKGYQNWYGYGTIERFSLNGEKMESGGIMKFHSKSSDSHYQNFMENQSASSLESITQKLSDLKITIETDLKQKENKNQRAFVTNLSHLYWFKSGKHPNVMVANLEYVDSQTDRGKLGTVFYDSVDGFGSKFGIWVFNGTGSFVNSKHENWFRSSYGHMNWYGYGHIERYGLNGDKNEAGGVMKFL